MKLGLIRYHDFATDGYGPPRCKYCGCGISYPNKYCMTGAEINRAYAWREAFDKAQVRRYKRRLKRKRIK